MHDDELVKSAILNLENAIDSLGKVKSYVGLSERLVERLIYLKNDVEDLLRDIENKK
jgi:hypothetical protein